MTLLPPLVPDFFASSATRGQWTPRTAGGCSNNVWSYFQNPQWILRVPECVFDGLVFVLECSAGHSVNVRLFPGMAARPDALGSARSSGPYRRSSCVLRLNTLAPTDLARPGGPRVATASVPVRLRGSRAPAQVSGEVREAWAAAMFQDARHQLRTHQRPPADEWH
eukprot:CAMPEP_0117610594 /NCGR_PEP_ID=MMETSP0784-20121206/81951_1 /TAXON_ID=39447 /ORGANISM="" /LENGTH=165 /DNA_ID=CAMNT_0005413997 /DNA_START=320 /DNA_END=814 /DNA_ORIENTATION=+